MKVETNKDILEIELNSNLKRRRNECSSKLESMTFEENRELHSKRDELQTLQNTISTMTKKLNGNFSYISI
jgi:predicted nuclease with TOPRIM domain